MYGPARPFCLGACGFANASTANQLWTGQVINGSSDVVTYSATATAVNGSGFYSTFTVTVGARGSS